MGDIEFILLLLAGAALLVRVADLISLPYPIVLVLGGLAVGLVPGRPDVELAPEVVFLVFLPPLLHAAGWRASPRELRAELRPIALVTVGLVVATIAAVAVVAHATVDGMSWTAAVILGALLAPTDPIAALAIFGRLGAPERVRMLIEGEAMLNDAVPLVTYRVALAAALSGTLSAPDAALDFVVAAAGGTAVGLAVGWAATQIVKRLSDMPLTIFTTVLTAYAGYIVAEELGVSGVLGAVVSGLYSGWHAHEAFDADTRLSAVAFWEVLVFALNAMLFVLLGTQFPTIIEELEAHVSIADLAGAAVAVSTTIIAVRLLWYMLPDPGLGGDVRQRLAAGWAGMRGAISLAAALAIPSAVPERNEIVFITVAAILVTLVGQGLTLPAVLRALGVQGQRPWSPDEATARLEAAQAALDRLDELEEEGSPEEQLRRMRDLYRARFRRCVAVLGGEVDGAEPEADGRLAYGNLRRELIGVERGTLYGLRNEGRLKVDIVRLIERDLDLEEARLNG